MADVGRAWPAWRRATRTVLDSLVPLLAFAAVWQVSVWLVGLPAQLFPPVEAILLRAWALLSSGVLWTHVAATLGRLAGGFGLAALAGIAVGLAMGRSRRVEAFCLPLLSVFMPIPPLAWVPLFILWFGIFETSKVILIAVGVFFPIYLALSGAIMGVDRKLVEVGRVFRFSHREMITRVLLPAALPTYVIALRAGLGLGWMFVVAAEFMGAESGLGFLLVDGQMTGRPATILSAIVAFAILGKLTDFLLASAGSRFLRWQDAFKPAG